MNRFGTFVALALIAALVGGCGPMQGSKDKHEESSSSSTSVTHTESHHEETHKEVIQSAPLETTVSDGEQEVDITVLKPAQHRTLLKKLSAWEEANTLGVRWELRAYPIDADRVRVTPRPKCVESSFTEADNATYAVMVDLPSWEAHLQRQPEGLLKGAQSEKVALTFSSQRFLESGSSPFKLISAEGDGKRVIATGVLSFCR